MPTTAKFIRPRRRPPIPTYGDDDDVPVARRPLVDVGAGSGSEESLLYSAWKATIDTMHYKILDAYAAHITKHALVAHGGVKVIVTNTANGERQITEASLRRLVHYSFEPDLFPVFNREDAERLAGLRLNATELAMQQLKKEELADRAVFGIAKGDRVVVLHDSSDFRKAFVIVEGEFLPVYAAKCGMRGKVVKIEKNDKYQGLGKVQVNLDDSHSKLFYPSTCIMAEAAYDDLSRSPQPPTLETVPGSDDECDGVTILKDAPSYVPLYAADINASTNATAPVLGPATGSGLTTAKTSTQKSIGVPANAPPPFPDLKPILKDDPLFNDSRGGSDGNGDGSGGGALPTIIESITAGSGGNVGGNVVSGSGGEGSIEQRSGFIFDGSNAGDSIDSGNKVPGFN